MDLKRGLCKMAPLAAKAPITPTPSSGLLQRFLSSGTATVPSSSVAHLSSSGTDRLSSSGTESGKGAGLQGRR